MITMFEIFIHTRRVSNRGDPVMFPMFFLFGFPEGPLGPPFFVKHSRQYLCICSYFYTYWFYDICKSFIFYIAHIVQFPYKPMTI